MSIHLVGHEALFEMTAGRISVTELLSVPDTRFWIELSDDSAGSPGSVERELLFAPALLPTGETPTLRWLLEHELDFVADDPNSIANWHIDVTPPVRIADEAELLESTLPRTLEELGVVAGSTLRLYRKPGQTAHQHGSD